MKQLPALLTLVCLLLLAALGWLWLGPGAPNRGGAWQPPAAQAPQLDDLRANRLTPGPRIDARPVALVQRPLFAAGRRPPPPPAPAASAPATPPPIVLDSVRAVGIIAGPALTGVMVELEGEPRFLRRGDRIGDWELLGIRDRDITFASGDQRRVLQLPADHASPPEAAGAGPAAASARAPARPPNRTPAAPSARRP